MLTVVALAIIIEADAESINNFAGHTVIQLQIPIEEREDLILR
jgi:hypothetical protein